MLLPRATEPGQRSRLFVAAAGRPECVIGAAALGVDSRHEGTRWLVDIHVIEPFRRRGIGRVLFDRVMDEARAHGITSLRAREWVAQDSEAARVWTALGFVACQRKNDYEVMLSDALAVLSPLLERVRDRIPAGARIIPLGQADLEAVARLHQEHLGGNLKILLPLLNGTAANPYDPWMSVVLMVGDRVMGIALARVFADGTSEVDAKVVHPDVRRRWANVWLMHEPIRQAAEQGVRSMRYFTLDQHEDTRQLSERFGGVLTATLVRMGLKIPATTAAGPSGDSGDAGT